MAGNNERERIRPHYAADGAGGPRGASCGGELRVAADFAAGDFLAGCADLALELRLIRGAERDFAPGYFLAGGELLDLGDQLRDPGGSVVGRNRFRGRLFRGRCRGSMTEGDPRQFLVLPREQDPA